VKDDLTDNIRVKLNGNAQREFTVQEADYIYSLSSALIRVQNNNDGVYIPIWFDDPTRDTIDEVSKTAWMIDSTSVTSFQLEVEIPSTVLNPAVDGFYEFDDIPQGKKLGAIVKWLRQDLPAVGTKQDFNTLDKKEFIAALHLFPTIETTPKFVEQFKFTANSQELRELGSYLENRAVLVARGLTPDYSPAPILSIVFDYDNHIDSALLAQGLSEMTLQVYYNAAANGNLPLIVERVGVPI
jgi:hypothetical protein